MLAPSYPFRAIGRSVTGTIIEDLSGTAYVYADEIRVVVTSGFAGLTRTSTRQPRGLSAGLAYKHTSGEWAGHWDFRKQSDMVPIGAIHARGDTLSAPVEFRIGGTRGLDLREHWIVIQQYRLTLVPADGQWHEATRPIDSQPDIFGQHR